MELKDVNASLVGHKNSRQKIQQVRRCLHSSVYVCVLCVCVCVLCLKFWFPARGKCFETFVRCSLKVLPQQG